MAVVYVMISMVVTRYMFITLGDASVHNFYYTLVNFSVYKLYINKAHKKTKRDFEIKR